MLCLITKVRHAPPHPLPTVTKSLIRAHAQQRRQQLFLNFPIVQLFLLRSRMWLHFASAAVLVDRTSCFMWCVYCFFKVCAHISRWVVAQALQRTARWGSYCCGFLKQLSGTDASSWCHTNKSAIHNVHLEARGSEPRRPCTEKHHKPCVNFLPCMTEQPNVFKKAELFVLYLLILLSEM